MMWPFGKKKEKYIQVPEWWANSLAAQCDNVTYGFHTTEFTPHEVVGFASTIKQFLNG